MVFKGSQVDRSDSFLGMAWLDDLDDLDISENGTVDGWNPIHFP